jgi:hypothetical protein
MMFEGANIGLVIPGCLLGPAFRDHARLGVDQIAAMSQQAEFLSRLQRLTPERAPLQARRRARVPASGSAGPER